MLPYSHYLPALSSIKPIYGTITGFIFGDFRPPVSLIAFGHNTVLFASMPKAPIDENDCF